MSGSRPSLSSESLTRKLAAAFLWYAEHQPPCARWVTKGSPELNPCTCGYEEIVALCVDLDLTKDG